MVVNIPLVGLVGGRPNLDFRAVLEPHIHPLAHSVLLGSDGIYFRIFFDGPLELLLTLLLGFRQDVFVDHLAGIRITTRCVTPLPATVTALADVPFSVGSPFCHSASPSFATSDHTTLWRK